MKKFIIKTKALFKDVNSLESDLIDFLNEKEEHTFQRWLLTLTLNESDELCELSEKAIQEYTAETTKIPFILLTMRGQEKVTEEDIEIELGKVVISINLINLVKKGFLTYEMKDNDDDWIFTPTAEMKKLIEPNNKVN